MAKSTVSEAKRKVRFTADEYRSLVKRLPRPTVNNETSDLQAGYLLGIQQVLDLVREGWVIED